MKRFIACLLAFLMLASLSGCGIREKVGEKLAEGVIEAAGGGDVDIEDDKVVIKDESGGELVIGDTEWPKSELVKSIPEFKNGKITTVMDSTDSVVIMLESVKKADAVAYIEAIKKDFTQDSFEMNDEGSISYGAKNAEEISVWLQYSEEALMITVSKDAQ